MAPVGTGCPVGSGRGDRPINEWIQGGLRLLSLAGLLLGAGPAVFAVWVAEGDQLRSSTARLNRRLSAAGGLLFVAASLVEGLAVVWALALSEPSQLLRFFTATAIGRAAVLRAALGGAMAWAGWRWPWERRTSAILLLLPLAAAFGIVLSSHAAAQGWPAMVGDFIHIGATVLWIGGLWRLAALSVGDLADPAGAGLLRRFSRIGALAVLVLGLTGSWASLRNVYGAEALALSPYGQALVLKLAAVALLLAIAGFNLFGLRPLWERPDGSRLPAERVRRWLRIEAAVGGVVVAIAAVLAVLPPAERMAQVRQGETWRVMFNGRPVLLTLEPGASGALVLRVRPPESLPLERAEVELDMPIHPMAPYRVGLTPAGGELVGRAVLSMPGQWRLTWTLIPREGAARQYVTEIAAAGEQPLRDDGPGAWAVGRGLVDASLPGLALVGMAGAALLIVRGYRRLALRTFAAGLAIFALSGWVWVEGALLPALRPPAGGAGVRTAAGALPPVALPVGDLYAELNLVAGPGGGEHTAEVRLLDWNGEPAAAVRRVYLWAVPAGRDESCRTRRRS